MRDAEMNRRAGVDRRSGTTAMDDADQPADRQQNGFDEIRLHTRR